MSGELHRAGSSSAAAVVAAVNGDEEAVSATSTKHHGTAGLTDEDVARLRAEHGYNEVIVASESVWYSVRQPAPTRPRFHQRPLASIVLPRSHALVSVSTLVLRLLSDRQALPGLYPHPHDRHGDRLRGRAGLDRPPQLVHLCPPHL